MTIFDISPLLHPGIAAWPGDTAFSRQVTRRLESGDSVNLSSICLSLHTGAHTDAPSHFVEHGETIDRVDLSKYLGRARVVTIRVEESLTAADLEPALRLQSPRLLIRCNPGMDPDRFPDRFVYFTPEAAAAVGGHGVLLIGTDAPSVDRVNSKSLEAHRKFSRYGTAILENLTLRGVPDGEYELIALPLKIAGGDASPVRAVLRLP